MRNLRLVFVAVGVGLLAGCEAGLESATGPRAEPGGAAAGVKVQTCGYLGSGGCARDTVPTGSSVRP